MRARAVALPRSVLEGLRSRVRNPFARGLFTVSAGSAAVQLIGILSSPLTARVFSPAESGLAGVVTSLIAVCAGIACLRYEQAIPLPASREGRLRIMGLCLLVPLVLVPLVALALLLGRGSIVAILGEPRVAPFVMLVPVGILLTAVFNILSQWYTREQDFKAIVQTRLQQSTGQIGFQLSVGFLTGGQAWVQIVGYLLGFMLGIQGFLRRDWGLIRRIRGAFHWEEMRRDARSYRKFPLYNSWSSLLDTLAPTLPLYVLASLFGTAEAGHFRMAQMLVMLPIVALSSGITSVYWSESARLAQENPGELRRLYLKITRRLIGVGVVLVLGSAVLPFLVPIIFSPQWKESGYFAIIMAFPAAGSLVASAAVNLSLLNFNHWESIWIVCRLGVLITAAGVCYYLGLPPRMVLGALASVLVVGYVALVWLNVLAIDRHIGASMNTGPA